MDEALQQTIYDWFQFRPVCDNDKFNIFFNRVLNRDMGRYNELLRIQPGISNYDWLVTKYQETQWSHEGQNNINRSSELNGNLTSKLTANGTGHIGIDETTQNTEAQSGTDTVTPNIREVRLYEGSETTAHDTDDKQENVVKRDYGKTGQIVINDKDNPASKTIDTLTKTGSETKTHTSADNDKETHNTTKNGERKLTKQSGTGSGEIDTLTRNGTKTTHYTAENNDQNSGGTSTEHGETVTTDTTETPNTTETTFNTHNQIQIIDDKNIQKTLPMSSGGGDLTNETIPDGTNMPGFNWTNASGMSENTRETRYTGVPDDTTTTKSGTEQTNEQVTHSGIDTVTDTTGTHHSKDETTTEDYKGYTETNKKDYKLNETETESYKDYKETEDVTYHRNYKDTDTFADRTDKKTTEYQTDKTKTQTFKDYKENTSDTTKEHYTDRKDFQHRQDTDTKSGTEATEYGKKVTTNGTSGKTQDSTTQQTTDNTQTNSEKTTGTEAGQDASLDRLIHTGRDASAPELLTEAAQFIKGSSAWAWLEWRLEPCFLGIYDV